MIHAMPVNINMSNSNHVEQHDEDTDNNTIRNNNPNSTSNDPYNKQKNNPIHYHTMDNRKNKNHNNNKQPKQQPYINGSKCVLRNRNEEDNDDYYDDTTDEDPGATIAAPVGVCSSSEEEEDGRSKDHELPLNASSSSNRTLPTSHSTTSSIVRHRPQHRSLPVGTAEGIKRRSNPEEELRYYKIVYRGVVALLSSPTETTTDNCKSGSYLGYGEIVASRWNQRPQKALSSSSEAMAVRVDKVLTGGYAMDGPQTIHMNINNDNQKCSANDPPRNHQGFLLTQTQLHGTIAIPLKHPPFIEYGTFCYKILSSTPIPILTGPCLDAPKTQAVALPGTIHEVSLRLFITTTPTASSNYYDDSNARDVTAGGVTFMRLSHRKGWIYDRRFYNAPSLVKDVTGQLQTLQPATLSSSLSNAHIDDGSSTVTCNTAVSSIISSYSSMATTVSAASSRRRHRPPRKFMRKEREREQQHLHPPLTAPSNGSMLSDDSSDHMSQQHHPNSVHPYKRGWNDAGPASGPLEPGAGHGAGLGPGPGGAVSPDRKSHHSSVVTTSPSIKYLLRVKAPRGLKILDAPHFQVNNLIHGKHGDKNNSSSNTNSTGVFPTLRLNNHNTFHSTNINMSNKNSNKSTNAIFDSISKSRILPCGALFEASGRESSASGNTFNGATLMKLSDNSGWAIIPQREELEKQYRHYHGSSNSTVGGSIVGGDHPGISKTVAYQQVGTAQEILSETIWVQITTRAGVIVSCAPSPDTSSRSNSDDSTSPTSSVAGTTTSSTNNTSSGITRNDSINDSSEISSSVGSAFLDSMFRVNIANQNNKHGKEQEVDNYSKAANTSITSGSNHTRASPTTSVASIPCGMCVEVEPWLTHENRPEFARLKGGQGWIPFTVLSSGGNGSRGSNKIVCTEMKQEPDFRFGSFWFRVQSRRGIKVRLGPSRKAPSIKSEDGGYYFRFECGEFLRASEIMTVYHDDTAESFAKLYRNRHARLHTGHHETYRSLASLSTPAEWVQIHSSDELYLEECKSPPRIERHKLGWRYQIIPKSQSPTASTVPDPTLSPRYHDNARTASVVEIRKGPSLAAETAGEVTFNNDSNDNELIVTINERVTANNDNVTWLRLKDGRGWIFDDGSGESIRLATSSTTNKGSAHRHRHYTSSRSAALTDRPTKPPKELSTSRVAASARSAASASQEEVPYNTIIARLFHNPASSTATVPSGSSGGVSGIPINNNNAGNDDNNYYHHRNRNDPDENNNEHKDHRN